MKKLLNKLDFKYSQGHYEFIFDCGDLYLRENVNFDDDLEYCKSIIELKDIKNIKSLNVHIKYTIPYGEDILEMKKKNINIYKIEKKHSFNVELLTLNKNGELRICEDLWIGYEVFVNKLIKQIVSLKKIYFFGRNFKDLYGDCPFDIDDDDYIRKNCNNSKWENSMFITPLEDKDVVEQLVLLKKLVGNQVEINFQTLDEKENAFLKKEFTKINEKNY